ncbi:hypothetical protein M0657_012099 [Pyricularia oryzae]|nr:hypothetical protein M0657_012099 [Pyricularia oryzae]KAI7909525.1 hypothetical protein M9X92_011584 [Pyricularia oryzae]
MLLHHGHQLLEKLFLYPRNGDTATNWLLKRDIASSQRRQDSSPQGSNRLLRPYPAGYSIPTTDCQMSTRTPRKLAPIELEAAPRRGDFPLSSILFIDGAVVRVPLK